MSRSKFKVTQGLAQIITSGEPVYVIEIKNGMAKVSRPVLSQNGITHVEEFISADMLETRFSEAKRKLELEEYIMHLRKDIEQRLFAMPQQMKLALDQHIKNAKPIMVEGTK